MRDDESDRYDLGQFEVAVLTLMALDCGLQVRALEHLLSTVAFGVSRARLAQRATVLALRYWPSLFVDML